MTAPHELSESAARGIAERVTSDWVHSSKPYGNLSINLVQAGYAAANLAEARREGAREALEDFARYLRADVQYGDKHDHAYANIALGFRHREYPASAPEAVTLSNGERVGYDGKVRYRDLTWDTVAGFLQRDNERGYVLTDDEIAKLYALAAKVGAA